MNINSNTIQKLLITLRRTNISNMKKHLFGFFALVLGAFAMVSCNKDDDPKSPEKDNENEQFLTLEQQQDIISQSVNMLAQTIDFSKLQPLNDLVNANLGKVFYQTALATAIETDSILVMAYFELFQNLNNRDGQFVLDLSKLKFAMDFDLIDSVYIYEDEYESDTTKYLVPVLTNVNYNNDCLQFNVNLDGHKISLKVDASDTFSTISRTGPDEYDEIETISVTIPKRIDLALSFDGQPMGGLSYLLDTDVEITDFVVSETGSMSSSVKMPKTAFSLNFELVDLTVALNGNIDVEKGFSFDMKATLDNMELFDNNITVDATLSELFKSINTTTLSVWALNCELLRSIEMGTSLMGKKVVQTSKLENPAKDPLAILAILEFAKSDTLTDEMSANLLEKLAPFFTSDFYFAGYEKPQSTLEFINGQDVRSSELLAKLSERASKIKLGKKIEAIGRSARNVATIVSEKVDKAGITPVFRIHADEQLASMNTMMAKTDLSGALTTITDKFVSVFTSYRALINLIMNKDAE